MKKDNWIFTLLIFVVLGIICVTFYGITKFNQTTDQSVSEIIIRELIISNLSSDRVTISWITSEEATATLRYGVEKENLISSEQETVPTKIHYINLENLTEATTYFFEITIEGQVFVDETKDFIFRTLPIDDQLSVPQNLLLTLPEEFANSVIYIHSSDGEATSTSVSTLAESVNSLIDISSLRDKSTGKLYDLNNKKVLVSATNTSGVRKEILVDAIPQSIDFLALENQTSEYNPSTVFAQNIVAEEPEPTPEPEPEPELPPIVEEPKPTLPERDVDAAEVNKPLPATAIDANVLGIIQVGLGMIIISLGVSLYFGKD